MLTKLHSGESHTTCYTRHIILGDAAVVIIVHENVYAVVDHRRGHRADGVHAALLLNDAHQAAVRGQALAKAVVTKLHMAPQLARLEVVSQPAHQLAAKVAKRGIMSQGKTKPPSEGGADGWV